LDIELYVDEKALMKAGFSPDDLVDEAQLVDSEKIGELIDDAEASLVY
jgi:hypothetical protein